MEALYGVNLVGYYLHHNSMLENGGVFEACGILAIDATVELSLAVQAGLLCNRFWSACIISQELVEHLRICIRAVFFGVEHKLVHICSSLQSVAKEVCALLKQHLGHFRKDTPVLGNDSSGHQILFVDRKSR